MPAIGRLGSFAAGIAVGTAGGMAFAAIGTPLPYMLGAMASTIAASLAGVPLVLPSWARKCIVPVLGVMFGSVLDLGDVPGGWSLAAITGFVIVYLFATISIGWCFFRAAGYDPVTSYFAAVPGNLSEISAVAEDYGADLRLVVLAHSARIAIAITAISLALRYGLGLEVASLAPKDGPPPQLTDLAILLGCAVIGFWGGRLIRMPSAALLGPLLASVFAHNAGLTAAAPPSALVAAAQIVLGVFIGVRFSGVKLREVGRALALSAAWAVLLLAIIAGYVLLVSAALGVDYPAMLLAFTPGGIAEASALAIAAGLGLGFVTTVQVIRVACVLVVGPQVIRRLFSRPQ